MWAAHAWPHGSDYAPQSCVLRRRGPGRGGASQPGRRSVEVIQQHQQRLGGGASCRMVGAQLQQLLEGRHCSRILERRLHSASHRNCMRGAQVKTDGRSCILYKSSLYNQVYRQGTHKGLQVWLETVMPSALEI